eukprot:3785175-Rhodomonas_salina.1
MESTRSTQAAALLLPSHPLCPQMLQHQLGDLPTGRRERRPEGDLLLELEGVELGHLAARKKRSSEIIFFTCRAQARESRGGGEGEQREESMA